MLIAELVSLRLDSALFLLCALLFVGGYHFAHRRELTDASYPRAFLPSLAFLLVAGIVAAESEGQSERSHMARLLEGQAPTFAGELLSLGLARIVPETPADDPVYLGLIEAQKRWLAANPQLSDIYTGVRLADGDVAFLVDSESDYNRDGDFGDPREERTPIGTRFDDPLGEMSAALDGQLALWEHPYADPWGYWISAYANAGRNVAGQPIVVGVDFAAGDWIRSIARARLVVLAICLALVLAACQICLIQRRLESRLKNEQSLRADVIQARELAEQGNRVKTAFIKGMSHEIRTPLNGMLGLVELVADSGIPGEEKFQLRRALDSGRSLLNVLNDLLEFARTESEKPGIAPSNIDLGTLVLETVELFSPTASARELKTGCALAPDVPRLVRCDGARLRQVLTQLMANAIKFTERGSVRLQVRCTARGEGSARLRFAVMDTGIGIDPEQQPRIFEAFTQADESIGSRYGGSGLGLTLCRRFVEAMDGEIGVESTLGAGSTFWFEIPVEVLSDTSREVPAAPPETPAAAPSPGTVDVDALPLVDVLVVDDDETGRTVVGGMLKRLGLSTASAADGVEASMQLAQSRFRLVLMDLRMPRLDGIETTKRWRAGEAPGSRVPIVALTANAQPGQREACIDGGMDDMVLKPVSMASIRELVERYGL
ncbi:MAG: ATP-binding protein, partial [Gammaproteobacteria bacterium]